MLVKPGHHWPAGARIASLAYFLTKPSKSSAASLPWPLMYSSYSSVAGKPRRGSSYDSYGLVVIYMDSYELMAMGCGHPTIFANDILASVIPC